MVDAEAPVGHEMRWLHFRSVVTPTPIRYDIHCSSGDVHRISA
jgi:hypothetical protein